MPIFIKLRTKCTWLKGIHVCSNERPCPFKKVHKSKKTSTKFSIIPTESISTKLGGIKHPWEKETQSITNNDHSFLKKIIIVFIELNWCLRSVVCSMGLMFINQVCSYFEFGVFCSRLFNVIHKNNFSMV